MATVNVFQTGSMHRGADGTASSPGAGHLGPLNHELQPWLGGESGDGPGRGQNSDFALMF